MSDVVAPRLADYTSGVILRLHRLRRQIVTWFCLDGLRRLAWMALGIAALDMGLDWFFRMDLSQRTVMLALMAGALFYLALRWLARPLSASVSDDALILQAEDANKLLGQSLISALQFSRMEESIEAKGMSPEMVRQTVRQGVAAADRMDFGRLLDRRLLRRNVLLLAVAGLLFAVAGVAIACEVRLTNLFQGIPHQVGGWLVSAENSLAIWFNRNILLGDRVWPQQTYLKVLRAEQGKVKFPRGEDWTQVVEVEEKSTLIPDRVYIDFRRARGRAPQAMKKNEQAQFEAVFANVLEPFEFRARGGDAYTDWIQVELVEQPAVEALTLEVTSPAYAKESPQILPPGKGPYFVLRGSSLSLRGTANKPLQRAALLLDGKPQPLTLSSPTEFSGAVAAGSVIAGQYVVELEDTTGLTSRRPLSFGLRFKPDREPRVRAKLAGISGMVLPRARIPLNVRINDDFAVSTVEVKFAWEASSTGQADKGQVPLPAAKSLLGQADVVFDDMLDLEPLKLPAGAGFRFWLEAKDNDDVSGPNLGKSPESLHRVVTEEEFRADLLRREREQRQEFARLVKLQEELNTDCQALQAGLTGRGELAAEQREPLLQFPRRQRLASVNTAAIAERFSGILGEVINNRLDEKNAKIQEHLHKIIQPLQAIAEADVPAILQKLEETRRVAADAPARDAALAETVSRQADLLKKMNQVLDLMDKSEGFQEAVNWLYEIQKLQQDVYDRTLKEKAERVKGVIEGKPAGGDKPNPKEKQPDEKQKPAPPGK